MMTRDRIDDRATKTEGPEMTKLPKLFAYAALAVSVPGCATLFASSHDRVYITPPPGTAFSGVSVTDNGEPREVKHLTQEEAFALDDLPKGTVYVEVSSTDDHKLVVTDGATVSQFGTETELAAGWFVLDLFTTGPIGIVVDWVTHAWRRPTPLVIHTGPSRSANR